MTRHPTLLPADLGPFKVELPAPHGRFRGPPELCQIRATNDLQAIAAWLSEYADSPHTLANYRKEVERLLMWAASLPEPTVLSGLMREDFVKYDKFLADPQPAEKWIGPPVPRTNPKWKPFSWHRIKQVVKDDSGAPVVNIVKKSGLTEASRRQAFDVLRALYGYLQDVGYMAVNPLAKQRRKRHKKAQRRTVQRYLDRSTWDFLVEFIETLPQETKRQQQHYRRVRWLFYLLYLTRARRAEVASANMVDFYRDDADGLWYWHVLGKGEKEREIPVSDELLTEYVAYRRFFGMGDFPTQHEDTALVLSITGRSGMTPKAIYLIVKEVCIRAAEALRLTDDRRAAKLEEATTHWLRHTSASHFVNDGGDLRVAQETLGHDDIKTTMIYQHVEKTDVHEKSSRLKIRR